MRSITTHILTAMKYVRCANEHHRSAMKYIKVYQEYKSKHIRNTIKLSEYIEQERNISTVHRITSENIGEFLKYMIVIHWECNRVYAKYFEVPLNISKINPQNILSTTKNTMCTLEVHILCIRRSFGVHLECNRS